MIFKKNKIFLVAEIGNNHEGNFFTAKKLISEAAKAGADAVKFQTINPENFYFQKEKKRIRTLKKFQFSIRQFKLLSIHARKKKIIFFSTPFDIDSAVELNKFQSIFKVSSGDNNFFTLIEKIAHFKKPIIISTGFANTRLLKQIQRKIIKIWKKYKIKKELCFQHCVSDYPTMHCDANINVIPNLKKHFPECIVGYSDHTKGIEVAKLAILSGARIIEKHFTLSKTFSSFRDHAISADPKEMKQLSDYIKYLPDLLGNGAIELQDNEKKNFKNLRRSIYASRDIAKSEKISLNNINFLRPELGISVDNVKKVIGKFARKNIKKGDVLRFSKFK